MREAIFKGHLLYCSSSKTFIKSPKHISGLEKVLITMRSTGLWGGEKGNVRYLNVADSFTILCLSKSEVYNSKKSMDLTEQKIDDR